MRRTHAKHYRRPGEAQREALSLAWLAEVPDGARIVRVLAEAPYRLDLEYLPPMAAAEGAAEAFGRALARTHAAGASHFGAPPPGWDGPGGIGLAPMSYCSEAGRRWGEFYAAERVLPYARAAAKRGTLEAEDLTDIEAVAARLDNGDFDSPQPGLLAAGQAARLHGDLWTGNVMWIEPAGAGREGWTGAALIDPSAHGGHAETDLAMLALFGLAGLGRVLDSYNEVSPLAEGWPERIGLHQLYPLLVHALLFGGSYGAKAGAKARAYL